MELNEARPNTTPADRTTFVDIHCHCLPGLDDGPSSLSEAMALCRALANDHIAVVVATPHQLGRFDNRYDAQDIRKAVAQLNGALKENAIPLTVLPGADVRIDERIGELLQSDRILTIADTGRHLMLELPHTVYIEPMVLLQSLTAQKLGTVITHPERQPFLAQNPQHVRRWAEHRPCLQITAASFLGEFGPLSEKAAWAFLNEPLPLLVATDAHDTDGRAPRMTAAYKALAKRLGRTAADILCRRNPSRLLTGQDLLPLPGPKT